MLTQSCTTAIGLCQRLIKLCFYGDFPSNQVDRKGVDPWWAMFYLILDQKISIIFETNWYNSQIIIWKYSKIIWYFLLRPTIWIKISEYRAVQINKFNLPGSELILIWVYLWLSVLGAGQPVISTIFGLSLGHQPHEFGSPTNSL